MADTSEQRTQRLARISTLETDLDNTTVKAARAFLAAASSHAEPEAPDDGTTSADNEAAAVATTDMFPNVPEEAV